jgi:NADH-quinone oxidoreductase subunit M
LPGLSGFVAEMTVFMGSWQHADAFHRIATIAAAMSIVVTAVYILRAIGNTVMGPVKNESFLSLKDASWNERFAAIILLAGILAIGVAPGWLNELLKPAAEEIMNKINSSM